MEQLSTYYLNGYKKVSEMIDNLPKDSKLSYLSTLVSAANYLYDQYNIALDDEEDIRDEELQTVS